MPKLKMTPAQKREEGIKQALRLGKARKGVYAKDIAKRTGLTPKTVNLTIKNPLGREVRTLLAVADTLGVDLFRDEIINPQ